MPSFTHSDLYTEVKDLIRPQIESEHVVNAAWVIPLMETKHPMPRTWRGVHAHARRIAYREHIRDLARAIVREFKKKRLTLIATRHCCRASNSFSARTRSIATPSRPASRSTK